MNKVDRHLCLCCGHKYSDHYWTGKSRAGCGLAACLCELFLDIDDHEESIRAASLALQRELVEALKRNLERMKLINGPNEKCIGDPSLCFNHQLIHDTEALIIRASKELA